MNLDESQANTKTIKTVWVISDGIAGHFNQSKGVLIALEHMYELQVEWIDLHLKSGLYRRLLGALLNHTKLSLRCFNYFYDGRLPSSQPDIVIGAGGKSSFAVAWLGQVFTAKTIFVGSLRHLKPNLFNAVLVLEALQHQPFISLQIAPMPITQTKIKLQADAWIAEYKKPVKPVWAMLIGGDGAGATYSPADWQCLAGQMNLLAKLHNIQWLVTTSRRTGNLAELSLQQCLIPEAVVQAVWWHSQPKAVTQAYLSLSDIVFCTIDSMSMLMESISAMRPVVAIQPENFTPNHNFQAAISRLTEQQLLLQAEIKELPHKINNIYCLKPLKLEPSITLAQKLTDRLES